MPVGAWFLWYFSRYIDSYTRPCSILFSGEGEGVIIFIFFFTFLRGGLHWILHSKCLHPRMHMLEPRPMLHLLLLQRLWSDCEDAGGHVDLECCWLDVFLEARPYFNYKSQLSFWMQMHTLTAYTMFRLCDCVCTCWSRTHPFSLTRPIFQLFFLLQKVWSVRTLHVDQEVCW